MERFESLLDRFEKSLTILESHTKSLSPEKNINKAADMGVQSAQEFESLIKGPLNDFIGNSSKIDVVVADQASLLQKCFVTQGKLIDSTCSSSELQKQIEDVIEFKDKNRMSNYINHLQSVAASVLAFGWVMTHSPEAHITSMMESGEFYTNRILKDFKQKDPIHSAWVQSLRTLWTKLAHFVRKHYPTGLTGNGAITTAPSSVTNPPIASGKAGKAELFKDLNRGEVVTASLRKVTNDMKTHKTPGLRGNTVAPVNSDKLPSTQKRGRLELDDTKWLVENFEGTSDLKIVSTSQKETVMIYGCTKCTVQIQGKVNSIAMINCKNTGVVFDGLVSSFEVVNSKNVKIQTLGLMPGANINNTDVCEVFLNEESKFADIITSKSSTVNVAILKEDGDFNEFPVPEILLTKFNGQAFETTIPKLS